MLYRKCWNTKANMDQKGGVSWWCPCHKSPRGLVRVVWRCETCDGTGKLLPMRSMTFPHVEGSLECSSCGGTGWVASDEAYIESRQFVPMSTAGWETPGRFAVVIPLGGEEPA